MSKDKVLVTSLLLPDFDEFYEMLREIYRNKCGGEAWSITRSLFCILPAGSIYILRPQALQVPYWGNSEFLSQAEPDKLCGNNVLS